MGRLLPTTGMIPPFVGVIYAPKRENASVSNPFWQNLSDNLAVKSEGISEWVRSLYGKDKRFKSARHLSLEAGLNDNTAKKVEDKGGGKPETLLALAVAAGRPIEEPLALMGLLPPNADRTDPQAVRASRAIQAAPEGLREWLADTVVGLAERARSPEGEAVARAGLREADRRQ